MSAASTARQEVATTNDRISALDEYRVKSTVIVLFSAGSSTLSDMATRDLAILAQQVKNEKGYLIEVAGFASSDGNADYNRRLSRQRADAVIQHMVETYSIPVRRFITPLGYGENQPAADNSTREGRKQNRRVEVRILVNRGQVLSDPGVAGSDS
jgi:outer membrane protein OmpA-like peptidoglycan-associated protein